jgi:uncharacterized repeat protein (TIGR01451 family)
MRRTRVTLGLVLALAWLVPGWAAKAQAQPPVQAEQPRALDMTMPQATPVKQDVKQDTSAPPRDALTEAGLGQTNENPTGRQEPAVSIEWIGPTSAKVGQPISYQIVVKNNGVNTVQDVCVRSKIAAGVKVTATEPRASNEDDTLVWKLGNLEPRQEVRLELQMVTEATGTVYSHATVTLSAPSAARLQVFQPKLSLKATAPEKVIVGDPCTFILSVSNPGDAVAERVKVSASLTDGLEHARGKTVEYDLGNLGPKETRSVQVLCAAKEAGEQVCEATATADPSLTCQDMAKVDVLLPRIQLSMAAPGLRYLERHAVVTFKVTNPGTAPVNHVTLVDQIPQGFKFVGATGDGRHDFASRTVFWTLGDLPPGQTQEVSLELVAINPGEYKNKAVVTAARGLKDEAEAPTRVEGVSALLMEVVDLDDPLEVGAETSYEIRVTNTGTKTETNVHMDCTVPGKMEFLGAKGPGDLTSKVEGKHVVFAPLPKLAPRADAIYRIRVKGLSPGDVIFQARMKADGLSQEVLKEESTKIYGDDVAPKGQ